jgi:hypothetical protein
MTFNEKENAKKFAEKITKEAIQDWLYSDRFDEWFWDRANEYIIKEEEDNYIHENLTQWIDEWFKV